MAPTAKKIPVKKRAYNKKVKLLPAPSETGIIPVYSEPVIVKDELANELAFLDSFIKGFNALAEDQKRRSLVFLMDKYQDYFEQQGTY